MTNTLKAVGLVVVGAVVGALVAVSFVGSLGAVGGVYNKVTNYFADGISVGSTGQFAVSSTGVLTTSGSIVSAGAISGTSGTFSGDVTIPTTQGATSTLIVGQVQTYATSAATVVCQKYLAVATTSANGFVTWSYGSCP